MGWLLEERGRASIGQWLGVALLALGVVTGQLRAPQILYAAWLENISVGVAATTSLVRSNRPTVHVPAWVRRRGLGHAGGRGRPTHVRPPTHLPTGRSGVPVWERSQPPPPVAPPAVSPPPVTGAPPPPPPGARPSPARPPVSVPVPEDHISVPLAVGILVVPLLLVTSFQGQFIGTMAMMSRVGADDPGAFALAGGPLPMALLIGVAAVRAFRRIDPDAALGYAFGHIVALHLGMFVGFVAMIAAVIGGLATGTSDRAGPLEVAATLLLVVWFVATDRLRTGEVR